MPRGRHRHSPPLHRLLPPSAVAGFSLVCAGGAWMFAEPVVLRGLVAAAAASAVVGSVVMRRWDQSAGKRVAELGRMRASEEWRYEERIAECESDLEEARELRTRLENKLRAKRAELAALRNEHAALLRRYATAETERASALEGRRLLAKETSGPPALPAAPARDARDEKADSAAPERSGTATLTDPLYARANAALAGLAGADAGLDAESDAGSDAGLAAGESGEVLGEASGAASAEALADGAYDDTYDDTYDDERGDEHRDEDEYVDAYGDERGDGGADERGDAHLDEHRGEGDAHGDVIDAPGDAVAPVGDEDAGDLPGKTEAPAEHGGGDELVPARHFTVPAAAAVVPPARVRQPADEGGFDFFGTKGEAAKRPWSRPPWTPCRTRTSPTWWAMRRSRSTRPRPRPSSSRRTRRPTPSAVSARSST
ncbi:hypothetical protein RB200_07675 [Streptomyces sp. PmtG]